MRSAPPTGLSPSSRCHLWHRTQLWKTTATESTETQHRWHLFCGCVGRFQPLDAHTHTPTKAHGHTAPSLPRTRAVRSCSTVFLFRSLRIKSGEKSESHGPWPTLPPQNKHFPFSQRSHFAIGLINPTSKPSACPDGWKLWSPSFSWALRSKRGSEEAGKKLPPWTVLQRVEWLKFSSRSPFGRTKQRTNFNPFRHVVPKLAACGNWNCQTGICVLC